MTVSHDARSRGYTGVAVSWLPALGRRSAGFSAGSPLHTALRDAANGMQQGEKVVLEPPVSVKKSITPDFLISMEDGKRYKSLKRHLTGRGLTGALRRKRNAAQADNRLGALHAVVIVRHKFARLPVGENQLTALFHHGANLIYIRFPNGVFCQHACP
jgi:ROS/MUCR transcriptional regulator protein